MLYIRKLEFPNIQRHCFKQIKLQIIENILCLAEHKPHLKMCNSVLLFLLLLQNKRNAKITMTHDKYID